MDVVDNFGLVNFFQLDIQDEDSVNDIIMQLDNMVQFDEYRMPNDKHFLDNQEEPNEGQDFDEMQM